MALARAWDGCDAVYLSFDIDVIEARHGGNEEGLERGAGQRPRLVWVGAGGVAMAGGGKAWGSMRLGHDGLVSLPHAILSCLHPSTSPPLLSSPLHPPLPACRPASSPAQAGPSRAACCPARHSRWSASSHPKDSVEWRCVCRGRRRARGWPGQASAPPILAHGGHLRGVGVRAQALERRIPGPPSPHLPAVAAAGGGGVSSLRLLRHHVSDGVAHRRRRLGLARRPRQDGRAQEHHRQALRPLLTGTRGAALPRRGAGACLTGRATSRKGSPGHTLARQGAASQACFRHSIHGGDEEILELFLRTRVTAGLYEMRCVQCNPSRGSIRL